jgi:hypothetical protein
MLIIPGNRTPQRENFGTRGSPSTPRLEIHVGGVSTLLFGVRQSRGAPAMEVAAAASAKLRESMGHGESLLSPKSTMNCAEVD